jgi:hypothetical protein
MRNMHRIKPVIFFAYLEPGFFFQSLQLLGSVILNLTAAGLQSNRCQVYEEYRIFRQLINLS